MKPFIIQMKQVIFYIIVGITINIHAQVDRSIPPPLGPTPVVDLTPPDSFQLSNGLTVFVVENHKFPKINLSLSLDNPPSIENDKVGVSTLVSKIMGKGTTTISKTLFYEEIDFLGASLSVGINGGYAQSLSKHKDRIIALFADALLHPNFIAEELALEQKKIKEHLKNEENSSGAIMSRVKDVLVYGKTHPKGEYVTEETITNVTLSDLKLVYQKQCIPDHAYMVISGDITMAEAKAVVGQYFEKWTSRSIAPETFPEAPNVTQRQINLIDMRDAVQTEIVIVNTAALRTNGVDHHAALLANYILGGGFTSYINMNLREQHAFTYGARSTFSRSRQYKGAFKIQTKVRNAVTDSAVVELLNEVKRIRTVPVTDEVLKNAKAQFLGSFVLASENDKIMAARSIKMKTAQLPSDFYTTFIDKINAVTPADIQRVAKQYFKLDTFRIVLVGKASEIAPKLEALTFDGASIPIVYFDKKGNAIVE